MHAYTHIKTQMQRNFLCIVKVLAINPNRSIQIEQEITWFEAYHFFLQEEDHRSYCFQET